MITPVMAALAASADSLQPRVVFDLLPRSKGSRCRARECRCGRYVRFCGCDWEQQLPQRAIGQSLRLSQGAVSDYLKRARRAGLAWPLPDDLDDARLEALLFPPPPDVPADQRPVPDWSAVHRDMRRPNVTLALLWEEYRAGPPTGSAIPGSAICIARGSVG